MKYILSIASALCMVASACSSTHTDNRAIAVSIPPQKAILEALAGPDIDIVTLMRADANPETFEVSVSDMRRLASADAFFMMGNMEFEEALVDRIAASSAKDIHIYNTSEGIDFIYGTHEHHGRAGHKHEHGHRHQHEENCSAEHDGKRQDEHDGARHDEQKCDCHDGHEGQMADPHTWTSIPNMRIIAANMLAGLKETDAENACKYEANYRRFIARLDSLETIYAKRLEPYRGKSFLIWHPSLSYFARDYGLKQMALGQEHKELSVIQLRETLKDASDKNSASALFIQRNLDSRQADNIARQLRLPVTSINPLSADWENEFNTIVNAITGK